MAEATHGARGAVRAGLGDGASARSAIGNGPGRRSCVPGRDALRPGSHAIGSRGPVPGRPPGAEPQLPETPAARHTAGGTDGLDRTHGVLVARIGDPPVNFERDRERLARISRVVTAANGPHPARSICQACAAGLAVTGASIVLSADGVATLLASSDGTAAQLEDLQGTLGEGPCTDACDTGRPVSEPDLAAPRRVRWFAFGPAALAVGAAAVFAFPLRVGAVRLGALTLYRGHPGDLSDDHHADAQEMANLVAHAVLQIQSEARPGDLSPDLEPLIGYRAVVHQASGMVSVQLGIGVGEALVRLRAHAFAAERALSDVAADVVSRRLRLDE